MGLDFRRPDEEAVKLPRQEQKVDSESVHPREDGETVTEAWR